MSLSYRERTEIESSIEDAFEHLRDNRNVLAKADHMCCSNCAGYDLASKIEDDDEHDAYAFYHEQDAESLRQGKGVYIGYSASDESDRDTEEVGRLVAETLKWEDLDIEWDGDELTRIFVAGMADE